MIFRFFGMIFSAVALLSLAGAGIAAGAVWYYGRDLPEYAQLAEYKPPQSSLVLDDDGGVIARFARQERVFTAIDDIPPLVQQAFVSAEDKNFFTHNGIDPMGIAKAMVRNANALMNGGRMSGASTITQQVVKNTLLTNERRISRKIREAVLAVRIERALSKDRILEIYLNQIYLGARSYGVAAAARTYFGKPLAYLELDEAAFLAALPKAPSALHPVRNRETAEARRNYVIGEMLDNGYITEEDAARSRAKPLRTRLDADRKSTEDTYDWSSAYMIEEVRGLMLDWFAGESNAETPEAATSESESALYGGGLRIRTTLDRELQGFAADALRAGLHLYDKRSGYRGPLGRITPDDDWQDSLADTYHPRDLGEWELGVVLAIREDDGEALVGVEGRETAVTVTLDAVRWARRRQEDGGRGPKVESIADVFTPGDVIYVTPGDEIVEGDVRRLPVVERDEDADVVWGLRQIAEANGAVVAMEPESGRILAMQGGQSAQQSVFNRVSQAQRQPGSSFKPFVYAAALDHGYTPASIVLDAPVTVDQGNGEGLWKPSNYDTGRFYGPTPLRVGIEKSRNLMTVRIAQDIGMDVVADYARRFGVYDNMPQLLSFSLGAGETTLLRMATAYSMLLNGGIKITPRLVERVENTSGARVEVEADWVVGGRERAAPEDLMIKDPAETPVEEASAGTGADTRADAPAQPDEDRVIDPVTAFQTVSMMEGVVLRGTATKLTRLGFPVAGKTGTTNDARDAWFVGFTPDLVFGCYIGYDNPKSLGRRASGGALCGPVFEQFMRDAMADRTPRKFEPPEGVELVKIDRNTGQAVSEDVFGRDVIWEAFRSGTGPRAATSAPEEGGAWGGSVSRYIPTPEEQMLGIDAPAAPSSPVTTFDPGVQPAPGIAPGGGVPQTVVAPAPQFDPDAPLISFDPVTGQMIVAQDPAIQVEPMPGVVIRQAPVAPAPGAPASLPPLSGGFGNSAEELQGGRGLY